MTYVARNTLAASAVIGLAMVGWQISIPFSGAQDAKPPATQPATRPVPEVKIDMDKAIAVELPAVAEALKPAAFQTRDGKSGWVLKIPGDRPIATPAFAEIDGRGMVFVGGGYGSHEFYAFDARTGEKIWAMTTGDDGPTAAVVEDGYVAFNTESCTVIVAEARTGKVVWQEWLGDPLMSQPAISRGRLFMAHPAGQPRPTTSPGATPAISVSRRRKSRR
jgi:outer membrane protein assembly factor BamB